jgi:hypothetical protein
VALLKFESTQTIWVAGAGVDDAVREAFKTALLELSRQQQLVLPDRVRNLVPIEQKQLLELENALQRDLELFEPPARPEAERSGP